MRSRIRALHVAQPKRIFRRESSIDLAVRAAEGALAAAPYTRREIELVINCGVYRDGHQLEPAMSTLIQDRLDIQRQIEDGSGYSFDVLSGGCGMLTAAYIIETMILAGRVRVGLVVASDVNPDAAAAPHLLIHERGVAFVIEPSASIREGFVTFAFEAMDSSIDMFSSSVDTSGPGGHLAVKSMPDLLVDAYVDCGATAMHRAVEQSRIALDDVQFIVIPAVTANFAARVAAAIGVPTSKIITNELHGHALSTSTFAAFHAARAANVIQPGQRVALLELAAGASAIAAVYDT